MCKLMICAAKCIPNMLSSVVCFRLLILDLVMPGSCLYKAHFNAAPTAVLFVSLPMQICRGPLLKVQYFKNHFEK